MSLWRKKQLASLNESCMHDISLVGTDGDQVGCSKKILFLHIPAFRLILEPAERCNLEYHSAVIRIIVQFCYCGDPDIAGIVAEYTNSKEQEVIFVLQSIEAGKRFQCEDLVRVVERKVRDDVFCNVKLGGSYAGMYLTNLFKRGEHKGPLWDAVYAFGAVCPAKLLPGTSSSGSTFQLNAFVLLRLLHNASVFDTVLCLQRWYFHATAGNKPSDDEIRAVFFCASRIDLDNLSLAELRSLFHGQTSAIFPPERILDVILQRQAVSAPNKSPKTQLMFHISGAGRELSGYYRRYYQNARIFFKYGYNGKWQCQFILHYRVVKNEWLLSVTRDEEDLELDDQGEVLPASILFHAYRSTRETDQTVPFNGWQRVAHNTGEQAWMRDNGECIIVAPITK